MNEQVWVAVVAALGGITTTWLTVKYKDRVVKKNLPKDRMEYIFEGYEKLIHQQQQEIHRKGQVIDSLEELVTKLEQDLSTTRQLLEQTKEELNETTDQNKQLRQSLADMRKNYNAHNVDGKI